MSRTNRLMITAAIVVGLAAINTAWSTWVLSRTLEGGQYGKAAAIRTVPIW